MKSPRVLHILPQLAPYNGSAGRARAGSFLCRALARLGLEVTAVAPAPADPERWGFARRLKPLAIPGPSGTIPVTIHEGMLAHGRVHAMLVQSSDIGVVCRAALCWAARQDRWPQLVHASHGTELAPLLVKAGWLNKSPLPATVFHLYDRATPAGLDPSQPAVRELVTSAHSHGVHAVKAIEHPLGIGLACSNAVVVESKTYAEELVAADSHDDKAIGLGRLRERITPIPPGVDNQTWRFAVDAHVEGHPRDSFDERKAATKLAVQRELGLSPQGKRPLVAVFGPYQHLDSDAANALGELDCQLVFVLDSERDASVLPMLRRLARHRVATRFADTSTVHRATAAADFVLMPHAFVSQGPSQLYCWHYGAVPIAPRSGGFADAVVEIDARTATGSGFLYDAADQRGLVGAVKRAIHCFRQPEAFASIRDRLRNADLSWRTTAMRYVELYNQLT